jgi:WD40 repeat protein
MLILTGHSAAVLDVAFNPDATLLASASADSTVRGWSLPGGAELFRHTTAQSKAVSVAFAPDGAGLAAAYVVPGGVVHWYRPAGTPRPILTVPDSSPSGGVAFSPDARLLYLANDSEVLAFDATREVSMRRRVAPDAVASIKVGPGGEVYALRQFSTEVWVFSADLSSGRALTRGPVPPTVGVLQCGLSLSPDGSRIAFAQEEFVAVLDRGRDKTPRTWRGHSAAIRDTAFADAHTLLSASADGEVRTWDVVTGAELSGYDFAIGEVYCLAVAPDGLTAAAGGEHGIAVWDLAH